MAATSDGIYLRGYVFTGTDPATQTSTPKAQQGSCEAVGGGVFLTAAHLLNEYLGQYQGKDQYWQYSDIGITAFVDEGGIYANAINYLGQYDPRTIGPNDLADVRTPSVSGPSSGLTSIVAFADEASAQAFLTKAGTVTLASATSNSGASGQFVSVEHGTFQASLGAEDGDSGGAGVVRSDTGTDYIAGVVSTSGAETTPGGPGSPTNFAYMSTDQYKKLIDAVPVGADFGTLSPDLLLGSQNNEVIRGSVRKTDIITDGNNNVILAASGGGVVDTETGTDDVVILPSAIGESDSGTTIVAAPGITTLVGGEANDKLVLPSDRLGGDGALSDTSDTVQLLGGFNTAGSSDPDFKGYFYQNDPTTGPCYSVTYRMDQSDLLVGVVGNDFTSESASRISRTATSD